MPWYYDGSESLTKRGVRETAAQENSSAYYPLLDRIADGHFAKAATDKELYETFLDVLRQDGHINSPEVLSTFKLALSLRAAAPRIEAHYQYYRTAVAPTQQDDGSSPFVSTDSDHALPFDITLGGGPATTVYADITSDSFAATHKDLAARARRGEGAYRLRHRPRAGAESEALLVSGYGVELALKRTDYIVIDDREAEQDMPQKAASSEVVLNDEEEVTDLKPLSTSELSSLGLKAGSFIMQSDSPFDTLLKLTQDFPKYSASIAAHDVSTDFVKEHKSNDETTVPAGLNVLWMNGVQLIERQIQPFTLVDMLRRERKMMNGVLALGLTGQEAVALLGHEAVASAKASDAPQRFDWRDETEEGKVIIWLNDLEKDKRYEEFPENLMALLQAGIPGQIPAIRRDIFNTIFPVDLSDPEDIFLVAEQLMSFVKRKVPIRFGIVPLTSTPDSVHQAKIVYYLVETYGLSAMASYLAEYVGATSAKPNRAFFEKAVKGRGLRGESTALSFDEVFQSEHNEQQVQLGRKWAKRLNVKTELPSIFVDGLVIPRDKMWMQSMSMMLASDLRIVQQGVYYAELLADGLWLPSVFLEGAATRRNIYIFPENSKALHILDINKLYAEHADLFDTLPVIEANSESTKETWATLTVVADLMTEDGQDLTISALNFRDNNPGIRLDIAHNPATGSGASVNANLKANAERLISIESAMALRSLLESSGHVTGAAYDDALASFRETAKIVPGSSMLILNGRVIGPITSSADLQEEDFQQFLAFEQANRILPVYQAIEELGLGDRVSGPLAAAKLTSITALSTISDLPEGIFESAPTLRTAAFNKWNSSHTAFEVGDAPTATIHFTAVIDPASVQGQRWVPILRVLSELEGVSLKIFINPRTKLEELPVKRFFRYVLDSAPTFDENGKLASLAATFKGVPSEALLTVGMDVPPSWLVAPKVSVHDLDNVKLSSVKTDVEATYELENILIEGHSRDVRGSPPRGVQLMLRTEDDPHFADTIVMANLGYFQFKANPGYYDLQIKEGRSSDIFWMESVGAKGYEAVPGDQGTEVILMDFQGTTLYPRLNRKPGMEQQDVLEEEGAGGASDLLSRGFRFAESLLGGSKDKAKRKSVSDEVHAEINIFSVASGHLYERMLNIMMASVMKHTNHTVKFWFIEQFLSPSFKDFIPTMAEEYGFKYEMVTYKWPHWLRQQTEKQREIWGYKILFLDVLFPLSLDKVIFVDADQIVRTDMYELVQHDLDGAPYGFTPMCDSRSEMEGFRFWKQGYWKNYLKDKPYHISALYVVDLKRFRQLAAGDRLRQNYHTLSADPGSLSNLDQDLPNHMQFNIPIHSLPQEWLWCETWCSDETFTEARTIDLCNNPLTKEPKLDRARRQVPEWTVYDDEIAALDRRRKGLPAEPKKDDTQKVLGGEEQKNPKSRRLDGEAAAETHKKDEL